MARAISHSFAAPLEHKIHIFSPPCNILSIIIIVIIIIVITIIIIIIN